ncbi:casparian strip membrane protein 3-like [Phragmites australis]|uniref:casparian strip membrane protein 3-like n=1 Tax=Phragmites australis TaxID=29695 RepID=UPI002D78EEBD|nr:casparian strip membrane protein 3-like [Phragmites australis]
MEGKAPVSEHGETSKAAVPEVTSESRAASRGLSVLDLILRFVAVAATVGSAIAMGTTNQTLPFFTQFLRFKAQYNDLPALTFFVVVNSIVAAYLVLSIPLSIVHIIRSRAKYSRLVLVFFDAAMLALVTSAASAAAAIVYLAHKGNARANWFALCQQFDSFCERISGSLIGSFVAMALLILIILLSAAALARR